MLSMDPVRYEPGSPIPLTDPRQCVECQQAARRLVVRLHTCPLCGAECCTTERREP